MFDMDIYPVDACRDCITACDDASRSYFSSQASDYTCFAFHTKCYDGKLLRFLTGKVSDISVLTSMTHTKHVIDAH